MHVQHVSIAPTTAAQDKGRIALTPELLAATGARYSRNNEGLEKIVEKIDWSNTDKSVDSIFKMVDYGHASIADMAPVAMFIDGISIFLTYYLWANAPTGSGQESSTRYIRYSPEAVVSAAELGIKDEAKYNAHVQNAFAMYQTALDSWIALSEKSPEVLKIPKSVIEDSSEKGQKKLARIRRNFAFDRARVFLPICAKTNLMMVMSARSWVDLISLLLSHPLLEFQTLGENLKSELALVTPRLIRHASLKPDSQAVIQQQYELAKGYKEEKGEGDGAFIDLYGYRAEGLKESAVARKNRYSIFGDVARMTPIKFGWERIAMAELRDLNRHRTGSKQFVARPNGFYASLDQTDDEVTLEQLEQSVGYGKETMSEALSMLDAGDYNYMYYTLLGHTYHFEHLTTLDKFLYEAELRTGVGAHFRYAEHLRNCLHLLYREYPELKGVVFEGSAEPE